MAAPRKGTPKPETSAPDVSASGLAPEPAPESAPEPAPESAPEPEPAAPPVPVRRYQLPRPAPIRAGGHVLTERGWVLDPEQEIK